MPGDGKAAMPGMEVSGMYKKGFLLEEFALEQ